MTRIDREQIPFRLLPDQVRKLDRTARRRGQTRQSFIESAVLSEINADEERRRQENDLKSLRDGGVEKSSNVPGLGLAQALNPAPPVPASESFSSAPVAPVVVQVGNTNSNNDVIQHLATFVVAAKDFERTARMRTCASILAVSCSTPEERQVMAARLDEAIAIRERTSKATTGGGIIRHSFDALSNLFKGG